MPDKNSFPAVFARLKAILKPYARKMVAVHDTATYYYLNTRHIMKNQQPLCFGAVRIGKAYVSFYLMSVYACPDLLESSLRVCERCSQRAKSEQRHASNVK